MRGTLAEGALVPHAVIKEVKSDAGKQVKEWGFAEISLKKYKVCMDISYKYARGAYISSPEELPGDKNNGYKVTVHSLS